MSSRFWLCLGLICGLHLALSHEVLAQATVEGCSPTVMDAMKAKAKAEVAYDVAVTEEIVDKPDSVLATTCFNKAATNSGEKGGAIFSGSGPLLSGLSQVVGPSLQVMYQNFEGAEGFDSANVVKYTGPEALSIGAAAGGNNCDGVSKLWERVEGRGVTGGVPYATFSDLMSGSLSGGTDFDSNMAASQTTFTNLNSTMGQIAPTAVPAFNNNQSSCQVLQTAGVVSSCP